MIKIVQICLLWVLSIATVVAAQRGNDWRFDTDLYFKTDDNVNRAEAENDQLDDQALGVLLGLHYSQDLSLNHALVYSFELEHRSYDEWSDISFSDFSAGVEYRFRTRNGFTAPIYSLSVEAGAADYKSELRDGSHAKLGISVFKRLTDRVSFASGIDANIRDAESEIFDTERARFFIVADYRLFSSHSLYLQYQHIDGDIVSSARPTAKLWAARNYWEAWGRDDAFSTDQVSRWAYRFDAETSVIELGVSLSFNNSNGLQISVDAYDSQAKKGDVNYEGSQARMDYFIRF